jgi:hypothetical protein
MMMVRIAAQPIHRLATGPLNRVDLAGGSHRLQRAIHRGQADLLAAMAHSIMDALSALKLCRRLQDTGDRASLPRRAQSVRSIARGHPRLLINDHRSPDML